MALAGVPTKPTVVTKAADAAGTVIGNSFVKYMIIVALLGGATYGSVWLVKQFTEGVDQSMTSMVPREDKIKSLMTEARDAIQAKEFIKAKNCLDEVVRLDATKERNRTYMLYRKQIEEGVSGKSKP
ncbi:MAG: hypothetical protein IPK83_12365 [Planctomycetes bacterium]|nr:hypothetical protein [Planctomycetota bacterium]